MNFLSHSCLSKVSLIISCSALVSSAALADQHGEPYFSIGALTAKPGWNSVASGPQLSWRIDHPQTVEDLVVVDPATGAFTTKKEVRMQVNVLGVGKNSFGGRGALWMSIGSGQDWSLLFDGTPETVDLRNIVLDRVLPAGTLVNLAARGREGESGWYPARSTETSSPGLRVLVNDNPAPAIVSRHPEGFLRSVLSGTPAGAEPRVVMIGPKSALVFFELTAGEAGAPGFDLQDLVVMLSFETT